VVVVAAGNGDETGVGLDVDAPGTAQDPYPNRTYPCSFELENVVCVAALDQDFALASFSNYGIESVDVGAPGTNIVATWPGNHSAFDETYVTPWSSSGGGWAIAFFAFPGPNVNVLVNPFDWVTNTSALYAANTDARVWKTLSTAGADHVTIDLHASIDVSAGDLIEVGCKVGGGDPFSSGGTLIARDGNLHTFGGFLPLGFDLSACAHPTLDLSVGFRLKSDAFRSTVDYGVALSPLSVTKLKREVNVYNTIHGTSMATPVVAGVVALLRSFHPLFTPSDVRKALIAGGWDLRSLAGKTSTGLAVQVMPSLTNVATPTGLAYR
jgi:thermitase